MTNLRKMAKGQPCMLRLPGICNGNPETTVLAHVRRGFFGMGMKPPDICGFWACSSCHGVYDTHGSYLLKGNGPTYTMEQLDAEACRALCQQLARYVELGVLKW